MKPALRVQTHSGYELDIFCHRFGDWGPFDKHGKHVQQNFQCRGSEFVTGTGTNFPYNKLKQIVYFLKCKLN